MHGDGIRVERIVGAGSRINAKSNHASDERVTGHRRAAGAADLAYDRDGFGNISRFAHRHSECFGAAEFNELGGRNASLAGGQDHVRARRITDHTKFVVHAASNRGARGEK